MNDKRIKLSIIIPCYNEEATISQIIEKIIINSPFNNEIIVIDDCSTDKSKKILENNLKNKISKLIINEKNYGKGYSIRKGIEVCSGDIVIIQDADLEYDPSDYVRLVSPIVNGEGDVVYGSRFTGTEKRKVLYYWHSVGNKILTTFSNMLSNLNLTDMECCFKVFKLQLLKSIRLKENRFGFEPEITAKIAKLNINIYEVGVKYHGRKYSEGKKITWRDGFAAVKCILYYNLFDN
jgi:glycosyltransferase involved in cell wall biosynthesis